MPGSGADPMQCPGLSGSFLGQETSTHCRLEEPGAGIPLGWLGVAGRGGMRVCLKHPDPLSLASPLRGPSSAHPRRSGPQPSVGFTRTAGLRTNPAVLTLCCRKSCMRHWWWAGVRYQPGWGGAGGRSVALPGPPRRESCLDSLQTTWGYPSHLDQMAHISTMN